MEATDSKRANTDSVCHVGDELLRPNESLQGIIVDIDVEVRARAKSSRIDASNFCRTFKGVGGIAPGEFRRTSSRLECSRHLSAEDLRVSETRR